jgi:hypothetical protein
VTRQLTRAKAEQVLRAVEKQFAGQFDPAAGAGDRPTLYEPGFHADCWTIAWEGNYEWSMRAFVGGWNEELAALADQAAAENGLAGEERRAFVRKTATEKAHAKPAGVFTEPINSWCLGLYREEA